VRHSVLLNVTYVILFIYLHQLTSRKLQNLHARSGTEFVLIAVRPDNEHYLHPYVSTSTDRVSEFFSMSLQRSLTNVSMRLEAYCLTGIQGMVNSHRSKVVALKSEVSALISDELCEFSCHRPPSPIKFTSIRQSHEVEQDVLQKL
jgi:hypothetical protein